MAAAALLATLGAFYFSAIRPAEARLEAARESTASLYERIRQAGPSLKDSRRPPAEQLVEFYRLLPREQDLPERLEKIFAAAQAQGLSLDQGEYKTVREPGSRMMHYQITLPLKGAYPQVRKFLAELPREVPTVALKHIQFERQKVADPVVEAQIKLVLFLEQES
jgi:Tfp pilus assembly protein PilO